MNLLKCCFRPEPGYSQRTEGPVLASGLDYSRQGVSLGADSVLVFKNTATSQSLSGIHDDVEALKVLPPDSHSKACGLIQRLAEERKERDTASQFLHKCLRVVEVQCACTFASVFVVSENLEAGLLLSSVDAADVGAHLYKFGSADCASDRLLQSGSDSYIWSHQMKQACPSDAVLLCLGQDPLQYVVAVEVRSGSQVVGVLTVGYCGQASKLPASVLQWPALLQLVAATISGVVRDSLFLSTLNLFPALKAQKGLEPSVQLLLETLNSILDVDAKNTWFRLALLNGNNTIATMFDEASQVSPLVQARWDSAEKDKSARSSLVFVKHSILKLVLQRHQQLLVPDTQRLLNQSRVVCTDIFSSTLVKPPGSVMVYPFKANGVIYGALYVMSATRTDFGRLGQRMREVCHVLGPELHDALREQRQYEVVRFASHPLGPSSSQTSLGDPGSPPRVQGVLTWGQTNSRVSLSENPEMGPMSSPDSFSSTLSRTSGASLTNVLVMGLADKLAERRTRSTLETDWPSKLRDLQLVAPLGEGGFAKVFRGSWRGLSTAVKVVVDSGDDGRTSMKHAHEIAVLMTMSHPGVLQAYTCMTDVPVSHLLMCSVMSSTIQQSSSYKFLVDHCHQNCHIQVLEYCDKGTLCRAIRQGCLLSGPLQSAADQSSQRLDMRKLLSTLLEICDGLAYMQALGVVHCDLKPTNVLIKGSTSDHRGFTTKLADFGLSRVEDDGESPCFPVNSCGTVPYVPPEGFASLKVDHTVDMYAFGVLIWEMFTGRIPYASRAPKEVAMDVVGKGLRPAFPACAPPSLIQLAAMCWATEPAERPTFNYVQSELRSMLSLVEHGQLPAEVPNTFQPAEPLQACSQPPMKTGHDSPSSPSAARNIPGASVARRSRFSNNNDSINPGSSGNQGSPSGTQRGPVVSPRPRLAASRPRASNLMC